MNIIEDSAVFLSVTSMFLVCVISGLKIMYKFKISELSCCGNICNIRRDMEIEARIDATHIDVIPPPRMNKSKLTVQPLIISLVIKLFYFLSTIDIQQ